eukprot:1016079-Pyramimonas_sp.AAC.1
MSSLGLLGSHAGPCAPVGASFAASPLLGSPQDPDQISFIFATANVTGRGSGQIRTCEEVDRASAWALRQ